MYHWLTKVAPSIPLSHPLPPPGEETKRQRWWTALSEGCDTAGYGNWVRKGVKERGTVGKGKLPEDSIHDYLLTSVEVARMPVERP